MTKHSVDGHLVSLILLCSLVHVNWVSMVTNLCILLLYTLSLKSELVCHLAFNRHESFSYLEIFLRKRIFHFGIALSGV